MRRALTSMVVVAFFVGCGPTSAPPPNEGKGFSPVTMVPDLVDELRAKGKKIKLPFPNTANRGRKFNPTGSVLGPLVTDATQKVLVIFVEFADNPPGGRMSDDCFGFGMGPCMTMSDWDAMLFGTTYEPLYYWLYNYFGAGWPTDRTLVNYYKEVSYGKVDIVTANLPSAMGWTNVGKPYSYYCAPGAKENGFGPYPGNVQELVIDAINAVDPVVDFSQYANADGVIPNLFVVHAGTGAEWSGDPSVIWSHSWSLNEDTPFPSGYQVDGVYVNNYAMMPEVGGDTTGFSRQSGPFPPTVGVFAHEYGHVLGLPDFYDYGYESEGVGEFSLMAGGSWNTTPLYLNVYGNSPAHPDAWSKVYLGFTTPTEITADTAVSMPSSESNEAIYKMTVPGSNGLEYYLLENRQRQGFDQGLELAYSCLNADCSNRAYPSGLAIWHVDETVLNRTFWRCNEAENDKKFRFEGNKKAPNGETHYALSLIQADGRWDLEHGNWGDAGDLYPGLSGNTAFGSDTLPNSSSYYFYSVAAPHFGFSGITVSNIQETGGVIQASMGFAK